MRDMRLILAVAAIGVLVAWQVIDHKSSDSTSAAASLRRAAETPSKQALVAGSRRVSVNAGPEASQHPGQTEVCGLGWFDSEADDAKKAAILATLTSQGRHEIAARLLSDPAPFAQASGLLVDYLNAEDFRRLAATTETPPEACEGMDCPAFEARAAAAAHLADALARLASQTLDPRVYALAIQRCDNAALPDKSANACQLLNQQQWSRSDPDNGAPWLYALRGPAANNSPAVIDDALFHIAKATRYDDGFFAVAGEIARHAGADDNLMLGALVTSVSAIGVSAAVPLPLDKLLGACRGSALSDSNRRQVCEGVADTLVSRSDSLLMARMGLRIGRDLGWEPARGDALNGLRVALDEATVGADLGASCSGLKRLNQRVAREAAVGEMGWAREWLAANGKTEEEYTRKASETRLGSDTTSRATTPSAATSAPVAAAASR